MMGWVNGLEVWRLAQLIDANEFEGLPQGDLSADEGGALEVGLRIAFGFAGGIALVILAYACLRYVLSRGNAEETSKARSTIIDALIGLAIVVGAFGIISFVMEVV